jgi:DNA-binding transcriptional LysR family regulator
MDNQMDNAPGWDQIRYFVAVAREGSAAAAAQRLGVSHATVMRNVSQLEASLGIRLFDRVRSGYRITSDGEDVLASARAMEEHAAALVRRALGKNPAPVGLLRLLIADPSLFDPMPLLREFRQAHPRIEVAVEDARHSATARLAQLDTDAAILVTNTPAEELVGRQIGRVQLGWFAAPGGSKRGVLKPEDCEWVVWNSTVSGELNETWQRAQLRRLTPRPRIVLKADSHGAALAAVRSGVGAALLCDAHHQALRRLPFAQPRDSFCVWLLTHPDLRRSGRIRALFDFVAK